MKKSINLLPKIFTFFLVLFLFTSCVNKEWKLVSKDGVIIENGDFEKGSEIIVEKLFTSSNLYDLIVNKLSEQKYDKSFALTIYDISVLKGDVKLQPKNLAKVSLPVPNKNHTNYTVFHISDDGNIKELATKVENGFIIFETNSFSYFVIAKSLNNSDKMFRLDFDYISSYGGNIVAEISGEKKIIRNRESIYLKEGENIVFTTSLNKTFIETNNITIKWTIFYEKQESTISDKYNFVMPERDVKISCIIQSD